MRISDWSSDVCSSDLLSDKETNPGIAVGPGDPPAVLMTSRTTGPSKGVVMLHSQFYFFADADVQLTRLTADDVYMTGFPLFHGTAQFPNVQSLLTDSAHCVITTLFIASNRVFGG